MHLNDARVSRTRHMEMISAAPSDETEGRSENKDRLTAPNVLLARGNLTWKKKKKEEVG